MHCQFSVREERQKAWLKKISLWTDGLVNKKNHNITHKVATLPNKQIKDKKQKNRVFCKITQHYYFTSNHQYFYEKIDRLLFFAVLTFNLVLICFSNLRPAATG